MGSQDTHRRPDLQSAIGAVMAERQRTADDANAPEREAAEQQAKRDAALYGTAGWSTLTDPRRQRAAQHTARQAQGGADDAA